jgi:hypothetical protein
MSLQMHAPTTLVPARDFWTLRYTTTMEDGSLVVCVNLNCSFIFVSKVTNKPGHYIIFVNLPPSPRSVRDR